MSVPKKMKAITINGTTATLTLNRPVPTPRPDQLLVKVQAVALNPTDWKHIAGRRAPDGGVSGCDYAGEVVEVGGDVKKPFKKGQRVAGVAHGANYSNPNDGVFADYAVVKGDLQVHIPDSLSYEKAATFPLGASTVNQGLFQKALHLNPPSSWPSSSPPDGPYVLIYGGSTATGSLGIQLAILAGYRVLTTCSTSKNSFVTSLGAEKAFDYKSPTCGKEINEYTQNKLMYAWDTVSEPASAKICAEALSDKVPEGEKARYGSILPVKLERDAKEVESTSTLMYTIFNEPFTKAGKDFPTSKEDFESAKAFFDTVEKLLADGKLKTHPEKVGGEGLKGVLQGMLDLKEGKVRGEKLVYTVGETPEEETSQSYA